MKLLPQYRHIRRFVDPPYICGTEEMCGEIRIPFETRVPVSVVYYYLDDLEECAAETPALAEFARSQRREVGVESDAPMWNYSVQRKDIEPGESGSCINVYHEDRLEGARELFRELGLEEDEVEFLVSQMRPEQTQLFTL